MMPGRGMEAKALLQLADEALYQAKREGRNRVAVLEPIREVRRLATAG
jgi:PleD family two-component response regulator